MKLKSAICAALMLAASASASANLVTNGDFSTNTCDGWTSTGNPGFNGCTNGFWRNGAVGSQAFLSQVIATVAGQLYHVSFDAQTNSGFTISGLLDGSQFIDTGGTNFAWVHFDIDVVAANDNATLTFSNRNDPNFNYLDNVVVDAVPEPGTLALSALALMGITSLRRRKNNLSA